MVVVLAGHEQDLGSLVVVVVTVVVAAVSGRVVGVVHDVGVCGWDDDDGLVGGGWRWLLRLLLAFGGFGFLGGLGG